MAHRPNTVRIIGGEYRGRLLRFASGPGLRPTPDRVRETLFNWLGQDLTGLRCLDLFAGSGALGFEALSRHAAEVVFVDSSREVLAHLRAFAQTVGVKGATIRQGDALEFLRLAARGAGAPGSRFDVVFLDPPFGGNWLPQVEPLLVPLLAPGARVHVETEALWTPGSGLRVLKTGRAGVVHHALAARADEERS